ncbi:MAG: dNTP triphosphohydrolase [Candidatus Solibacter usitatus]|nr:dNTP triphosphohydrolase [Candidatus Solibacter usitatus]
MGPAALSYLRFPVTGTSGRRFPEPPHRYRNDFQRDRDRIIHSRAFRRLENKTQVFTAGISDHFRNRLTHTMEVAQLSRTVSAVLGLDEDLTEALALAHDIGHPPFGHSGEMALDRHMRRFGARFNHNLHALRLVESFEQRYAPFPGLNLTFEVREGIVKHSSELHAGDDENLEEYLPGKKPTLEAQLIDLADEIGYNTADLDDAHSAGLIDVDILSQEVPEFARRRESAETMYPGAPARIQFLECIRGLVDVLVSALIRGTYDKTLAMGAQTVDDVRDSGERLACLSPEDALTNAALKGFLHKHVYGTEALISDRKRSNAAIDDLFHLFQNHPENLPPNYREEVELGRAPHFVTCDYIAGMTDGYFWRTWNQFCKA